MESNTSYYQWCHIGRWKGIVWNYILRATKASIIQYANTGPGGGEFHLSSIFKAAAEMTIKLHIDLFPNLMFLLRILWNFCLLKMEQKWSYQLRAVKGI